MNKSELIEAVASAAGLEKRQAEAAIGAFVDSVVTKTKSGEPVSIFGFGTFKPTARAARKGRNPQTGAPVKIAASKGVKFQPATAFKTTLNTRGAAKKATAKKAATKAPAKTSKAAAKAPAKTAKSTTKTAAKAPAKTARSSTKATKAAATTKATRATTARATTARATTAKKATPAKAAKKR